MRSFVPPPNSVWEPWYLRDMAGDDAIIGHATSAPTTTGVADDGHPFVWGIAWRARSAARMLEHRTLLEAALS